MAKSISKLKDQARSHEQKEEWEKAAQLYQQALRAAEEEGSLAAEMGLYNRIGDIYLRLGRGHEAVAFFEQAADHYASDGLFNNAIALCNKALRHVPDRLQLYRKLGRLSASQGFLTDARRWFVEFAERCVKHGALDEAFDALGELADFTDDPEIRELLARQLNAHQRTDAAVDELRRAYAAHLRLGNQAGADAVREELRTIDEEAADSLEGTLQTAPTSAGAYDGLPLLEEPEPLKAPAPFEEPAPLEAPAPFEAPAPLEEPAPLGEAAPAGGPAPLAEAPPLDEAALAEILARAEALAQIEESAPAESPPSPVALTAEAAPADVAEAAPAAEVAPVAGLELPPDGAQAPAERPEGFAPTHFADDWGEPADVVAPELEPAAPALEEVTPLPLMEAEALEPREEPEQEDEPAPLPLLDLEEIVAEDAEEDVTPLPLLELGDEELEGAGETPLPLLELGEEKLEGAGEAGPPLLELDEEELDEAGEASPPLPLLDDLEPFELPRAAAGPELELPAPEAEAEPAAEVEEEPEPWRAAAGEEPWRAPEEEEAWAPPAAAEPWAAPLEEDPWAEAMRLPAEEPPADEDTPATPLEENPWEEAPPEAETPAPPAVHAGPPAEPVEAAAPEGEPADEVVKLARSLYAHGQPAAGRAAIEQLLADAERAGNQPRKLQLLDALAALEPDDLEVQQRCVEQAFAVRGPRGAVQALLGLAAAYERGGVPQRASVVYLQVLDIDPTNATAGAALRREKEARPKKEDDGGFVDLGALLFEDEEEREDTTRFTVSEATPTGDEEADFVEMLEQFKEKVAAHMGEDPQAHYDLGLAYKEMGLLDEAVSEFQVALRNGQDRLRVLEELGRCFLLKEQPRIALRLLSQALAVEGRTEMEYMGVNYLLGRCYEGIGEFDAARDAYERIIGLDIQFNDVAERLARL